MRLGLIAFLSTIFFASATDTPWLSGEDFLALHFRNVNLACNPHQTHRFVIQMPSDEADAPNPLLSILEDQGQFYVQAVDSRMITRNQQIQLSKIAPALFECCQNPNRDFCRSVSRGLNEQVAAKTTDHLDVDLDVDLNAEP